MMADQSGHSVVLAQVAERTRRPEVVGAVQTAPGDRHDVVHVQVHTLPDGRAADPADVWVRLPREGNRAEGKAGRMIACPGSASLGAVPRVPLMRLVGVFGSPRSQVRNLLYAVRRVVARTPSRFFLPMGSIAHRATDLGLFPVRLVVGLPSGVVFVSVRRIVSSVVPPLLLQVGQTVSNCPGPERIAMRHVVGGEVRLLVSHGLSQTDSPASGLSPATGHEKAATQQPTRPFYALAAVPA